MNYKSYERRLALKTKAVQHLGTVCAQCGYSRSLAALEFHHIDDIEKDFNISSKLTSWKRIEKELQKCVLLCANCHRETHDGYHPQWLELEYDRKYDDVNECEEDF